MGAVIYVFAIILQIYVCCGYVAPPKKCKLTDSACLKATAQQYLPNFAPGIPELRVDALDVMHLKTMKVDLSGLKLDMRDISIKGVRKGVIDDLRFDMNKREIKIKFHVDFDLDGKYVASGKLLVLPISGDGDVNMQIKTLVVDMDIPFEITKNSAGKDIIQLKNFRYEFDFKDGAKFALSNLFNGNKVLSDTMHQFMNENWKLLSVEFGRPLLDTANKAIFKSIRNYLRSQPIEEIAEL